jgi:hypothetical protein
MMYDMMVLALQTDSTRTMISALLNVLFGAIVNFDLRHASYTSTPICPAW